MNQTELDQTAYEVKEQMAQFARQFVTPISQSDSTEYGWAGGTGSYAWLGDSLGTHLLTNNHVIVNSDAPLISHLPRPNHEFVLVHSSFHSWPEPIDFACAPIALEILADEKDCLCLDQFDKIYDPVDRELLFFLGYPGTSLSRSDPANANKTLYSWGGELNVPDHPFVSQAVAESLEVVPSRYNPEFHKLIHYPGEARREPDGEVIEVRNPRGISGSLLWDTKKIASSRSGVKWKPEYARVCGMIWAAGEESPVLVATRIEHIIEKIQTLHPRPAI
ncbi:MAG: hypothetical protein CMP95_02940 [Gammaproteobacteria bacterium]|nr:hypothetical protein [Gammaproteobacteria bacterium]